MGAPTDNYDVALLNQFGVDVLQGVGANRDQWANEEAAIVYSGTISHPVIDAADTLTLQITNNVVLGAVITIDLYYGLGSGA